MSKEFRNQIENLIRGKINIKEHINFFSLYDDFSESIHIGMYKQRVFFLYQCNAKSAYEQHYFESVLDFNNDIERLYNQYESPLLGEIINPIIREKKLKELLQLINND